MADLTKLAPIQDNIQSPTRVITNKEWIQRKIDNLFRFLETQDSNGTIIVYINTFKKYPLELILETFTKQVKPFRNNWDLFFEIKIREMNDNNSVNYDPKVLNRIKEYFNLICDWIDEN